MKTGYYWRVKTKEPFVEEWQWRCEYATGGADTKEAARADLKKCGAQNLRDTTNQGGGAEFAHSEQSERLR